MADLPTRPLGGSGLEVLPACERLGLGFVPFFPLASGLLTDEQFDLLEALQRFASERGISMLELAIGSLLARPAVSS